MSFRAVSGAKVQKFKEGGGMGLNSPEPTMQKQNEKVGGPSKLRTGGKKAIT